MERTGREQNKIDTIEKYLKENMMFRDYSSSNDDGVNWTGKVLELDLSQVKPSVSGPKRPHDHIILKNL